MCEYCSKNSENSKGSKRGISLIEIIVAVGLLALLIFGAMTLVPRSLTMAKRAEYTTSAVNLAQAQMEMVLARDYQTLPGGIYETRQRLSSNPADYLYALERQTQITLVRLSDLTETGTDEGLKRITVIVFYPTGLGERSVTFSSLIARR